MARPRTRGCVSRTKIYIACSLTQKACGDGHVVLYTHAPALFRDLALGRADGSLRHVLARLSRADVFIVDEWGMAPMTQNE